MRTKNRPTKGGLPSGQLGFTLMIHGESIVMRGKQPINNVSFTAEEAIDFSKALFRLADQIKQNKKVLIHASK